MSKRTQEKSPSGKKSARQDTPRSKLSAHQIEASVKKLIPASFLEDKSCKVSDIAALAATLVPHLDNLRGPIHSPNSNESDYLRAVEAAIEMIKTSESLQRKYCAELMAARDSERSRLASGTSDSLTATNTANPPDGLDEFCKEIYPKSFHKNYHYALKQRGYLRGEYPPACSFNDVLKKLNPNDKKPNLDRLSERLLKVLKSSKEPSLLDRIAFDLELADDGRNKGNRSEEIHTRLKTGNIPHIVVVALKLLHKARPDLRKKESS